MIECGPLTGRWTVGDRVFGLVDDSGLASRVVVPEQLVTSVPDALSPEQAAATPEAFITAHDALISCASVRPGSTVLVTGGAGGVGSAAIQIARAMGAEVTGTARSSEGLDRIRSLGGEPVEHSVWLAESSSLPRFDIVIELVGGASIVVAMRRLAIRGVVVLVGAPEGREIAVSLRVLSDSRGSITGTFLRQRLLEERAAAVGLFGKEVVPLLQRGALAPQVDSVFPADRAMDAFARMESPGKLGKVLISFSA